MEMRCNMAENRTPTASESFRHSSKYFFDRNRNPFLFQSSNAFLHKADSLEPEHVWTEAERRILRNQVRIRSGEQNDDTQWRLVSTALSAKTPKTCYMQYKNVEDPSINKTEWKADEERNLLGLVEKYREHDWCNIASELATNRTPFECLRHYQQALNNKLLKREEFTEEEDALLKDAVEEYGASKWKQIASAVPGRNARQCRSRWDKCVSVVTPGSGSSKCKESVVSGRWMAEEERLLFLAALAYNAPRLADSKKSSDEIEHFLNGPASLSADASSSTKAAAASTTFGFWGEIAKLVPGK